MFKKYINIISAIKSEQEILIKLLKKTKINYRSHICGIGPLSASSNIEKISKNCKNQDILFIGTCGILGDFKKIEIVNIEEIRWMPTGDRYGLCQNIENLYPIFQIDNKKDFLNKFINQKATVINSTAISLNSYIKKEILKDFKQNNIVENLELYPVIKKLINKKNKISILLAITNGLNAKARIDWAKNHKKAERLLSEKIVDILSQIY